MGMGEIRVLRFTWNVKTCRWGQAGRRGQADSCLLSCMVGVEYGGKVTSWTGKWVAKCRDSKQNQPEQKNFRQRSATTDSGTGQHFYVPRPRRVGGIERSGCLYAHTSVRPPVRTLVDQVKIFVQGRISRPINGSKLIFHMSIYLYGTSRNIQEP